MKKQKLQISPTLALPVETVTSTLIVYGGKGMGKTNLLSVVAEELAAAGQRFSILDPLGVMWGLRHSPDGAGPGIEVLILGGRHGDLPIEPTSGAVVADLVVDESANVLIDISSRADGKTWSRGERIKFVTEYFVRLYERQGEKRRPILQIVDEAARFVPQQWRSGDIEVAKCAGAIETVVEEGRNVGIGICLSAQRSARMNKSVSELADAMIAFRTTGPNSITSILDWFGEHVEKNHWDKLLAQIRKLPRGEALVVSPGWLDYEGSAVMRLRNTFDSSATPKLGQIRKAKGEGAKINLDRYRARMAEVVENVKANDTTELKRQLAELRKQVKAEVATVTAAPTKAQLETARREGRTEGVAEGRRQFAQELRKHVEEIVQAKGIPESAYEISEETRQAVRQVSPPKTMAAAVGAPAPAFNGEPRELPEGEKRLLLAIAQPANGIDRVHLTIVTGYKKSTRNKYLQVLTFKKLIDEQDGRFVMTELGRETLGDSYEPLPTGPKLLSHLLNTLPQGEANILRVVAGEYPEAVSRDRISEAVELSKSSRNKYLQHLAARELIVSSGQGIRASGMLF